jgi:hypothetical protein
LRRIGSMLLASVLLGVPRALALRALRAREWVLVEVSPLVPELRVFAVELERALREASRERLGAPCRVDTTTVVDVLGAVSQVGGAGGPMCAVSLAVRGRRASRPLVVHYRPGRAAEAARALLAQL